MEKSYKSEFENWVASQSIDVCDTIPGVEYKKGDMVMFTNEYGIEFGPHEVLGFKSKPTASGRQVYFDHYPYWMACRPEQLTLVK